jgi:hypothetical protein
MINLTKTERKFDDFVTYFPDNLDENRYIEFNFYAPDLAKDVIDSLEKVVSDTANVIGSIGGKGTLSKVKNIGGNIVATADKVFDALASEINNRVKDKEIPDVSSGDMDKSKKWKFQINLPIPNNLQENLKHEWNTENGPVASILRSGVGPDSSAQKVINGIAALTGTRNVTTNPDYIQMYRGSQPRNITFSWSLMPNSKDEAERMLSIVRRFKAYSSPDPSKSRAFLTAPLFCSVVIQNENLSETIKLDNMVIDSVSVNYSGAGTMEMFADGIPKIIVLSVSLIERKPKVAEDWLNESESKAYKEAGGQ